MGTCQSGDGPNEYVDEDLQYTKLMDAARMPNDGGVRNVTELLKEGATVDLVDTAGDSALMYAADAGNPACAKALVQAKANPQLVSRGGIRAGKTPLTLAAEKGHAEVVQILQNAK